MKAQGVAVLINPPQREYRTWIVDSRRWQDYRPRPDDIVIATYPKCGTTWMQQIVSLLVFQSPEPKPVMQISAWLDKRFGESLEAVLTRIEAQEHRRFLKTHLRLDCLPFFEKVKYIHVARDGRDACMSLHNHVTGFTQEALADFDRIGLEDDIIRRPYPRAPADPADFFHTWVEGSAANRPFGEFEQTWWEARELPNVLLVHFNDLKENLSGEMRRIADFVGISVSSAVWPTLVAAAEFDAMRRDGNALMFPISSRFQGGSQRFFFKGTNERWRGVFRAEDLALYEEQLKAVLPPRGRSLAGARLARERIILPGLAGPHIGQTQQPRDGAPSTMADC